MGLISAMEIVLFTLTCVHVYCGMWLTSCVTDYPFKQAVCIGFVGLMALSMGLISFVLWGIEAGVLQIITKG